MARSSSLSSVEKEEKYDVLGLMSAGAQALAMQRELDQSHAAEASGAAMPRRAAFTGDEDKDDLQPCDDSERRSAPLVDERYETGLQHEIDPNVGGDAVAANIPSSTNRCNPTTPLYTKSKARTDLFVSS